MRSVILAPALAALAVAALGAAAPARAQVEPFVGTWRVTSVLNIPEYAALTQAQARGMIGRTIQVASGRVQVWSNAGRLPEQDVCATPEFQTTQANRARMLADYRIRQEDLAVLPTSFVELTVTCRGNFVIALRQVTPTTMIAELDTVFYRVERTATPPTAGGAGQQGGAQQGGAQSGPNPSFNCAQARTPDEQAICGDAALARVDRQLAETFGKLVTATPEAQREALRREQREWVSQRGKQCNVSAETRMTDAARAQFVRCLTALYATRQRDLDARLQRAQR
jgi:uncharacterized protein YecT (DUF1311 family)